MHPSPRQIESRLFELIDSPQNTLKLRDEAAFGMPLIGYASGTDPLFEVREYENGMPGLDPREWLEAKHGQSYPPDRISVISWALPIPEPVRSKMRIERYYPCLEWSLNMTYGTEFIRYMAREMEAFFEEAGIEAVAPIADERIRRMRAEKYGLSTNWSETMAAYIAGLGTPRAPFGLITRMGACVRMGSIIVAHKLPATARPYQSIHGNCADCGACAARCPAGAIGKDGVDIALCRKYQTMFILPHVKERFGFEGVYGCGLCMTGVPCESRNPGARSCAPPGGPGTDEHKT